jgi:phosphate transport system ATP-binding protein
VVAPATAGRPGFGVQIDEISAYYGSHQAVGEVSLTVAPNQVTALIGPSGCGKSTLIRCLNRMHEMTRGGRVTGRVLLDGENIYAPNADPVQVRRLVGMVFQKPNPFPMMSIYDNVVAGIRLNHQRVSQGRLDEIVERKSAGAARSGTRSRQS